MHGNAPAVQGAILLSPPLKFSTPQHLAAWAKHLWVGDAEKVLDEIVSRVAPASEVPLPRVWDGEMETADTSAYANRTTAAFKDVPMPDPTE